MESLPPAPWDDNHVLDERSIRYIRRPDPDLKLPGYRKIIVSDACSDVVEALSTGGLFCPAQANTIKTVTAMTAAILHTTTLCMFRMGNSP